jgi:hypothetical protein
MAEADPARVAPGRPGAQRAPFDDLHLEAGLGQVVGRAQSHDTAADHDDGTAVPGHDVDP